MARQARVLEILIASPGDVVKARDSIAEAIHTWNAVNSRRSGVILQPLRWEVDAVPELGARPQAIINQQIVDSADILIGAFWTRLGTETGIAASGTAEEIERFLKDKKPAAIYFSTQPVKMSHVDLQQYERLKSFKQSVSRMGLIGEFATNSDLKHKLLGHLSSLAAPFFENAEASKDTKHACTKEELEYISRINWLIAQLGKIILKINKILKDFPNIAFDDQLDEKHLFRVEDDLSKLMQEFGQDRRDISWFYRDAYSDRNPGKDSSVIMWRGAKARGENALLWLQFAKNAITEGGRP